MWRGGTHGRCFMVGDVPRLEMGRTPPNVGRLAAALPTAPRRHQWMRAKEARTTAKAKPGSIPIRIFDMRNIIFASRSDRPR
jgi:hypothetical protein